MNFASDIVFYDEDVFAINIVKEEFEEIQDYFKEDKDENQLNQVNYKVFMFCAYVGLIVFNKDVHLYKMQNGDNISSFNVPRTILAPNVTRIKELLICSKFIKEDCRITDQELQVIWNQNSYTDDSELTTFVKKIVVKGARYYAGLIKREDNISLPINDITENIERELESFINEVFEIKMQRRLDEEMLLGDFEY